MSFEKVILFIYLLLTVYIFIIVDITNLLILDLLPALLFLWINYAAFYFGYKLEILKFTRVSEGELSPNLFDNRKMKYALAIISVLSSVIAGFYYTGQTPISAMINIKNNVSLYSLYQMYFILNQRGLFVLSKIPFVIMILLVQSIMFYSYCSFIVRKTKLKKNDFIYLIIVTISSVYFGIVRGTNFEFFEIGILMIFVVLSKRNVKRTYLDYKTIIYFSIIILALMTTYSFVLRLRGYNVFQTISNDVHYDSMGITQYMFSFIASLSIKLYGYFGHGFNYISVFINDVLSISVHRFIAGLIPFGYNLFYGVSIHSLVSENLDMGVMWQPDYAIFVSYVGIIGLIFINFMLGMISKNTYNSRNPLSYFIRFLILLQMISFPVGHFIFTSSSNILMSFCILMYWAWQIIFKNMIRNTYVPKGGL